jgi:hypothetical protein
MGQVFDCSALDCFYNSRVVDKFGGGECTTTPSINCNGKCLDYDVHSVEDFKRLTGGDLPKDLTTRIVEGRDKPFDEWPEDQKAHFKKLCNNYNINK